MKKLCFWLFFFTSFTGIWAQDVLLVIGNDTITKSDFLQTYQKNSRDKNGKYNRKELEDYLDLYINFKLKVLEAERSSYDTISYLRNEYLGYRADLAKPYLTDTAVDRYILEEAYQNMGYDLRVKHILVKVGEGASPSDTMQAYRKIMAARKEVMQGTPFSKVALKYSDELARLRNNPDYQYQGREGDIGYFTVFNMVYPFEKMAYSMKVGEISKPVRTRFGYHIIQLLEKHPALGTINASHILVIERKSDTTEALKAEKKQRIENAYKELQEGVSFAEVANKYSDDKMSLLKGGSMGDFEVGRMHPDIIKKFYSLQKGEITPPFQTDFGWHILRFDGNMGRKSFEEEEKNLLYKISKDDRARVPLNVFAEKLLKKNGFKENRKVLENFKKNAPDNICQGKWKAPEDPSYQDVLFEYRGQKVPLKDFLAEIAKDKGDLHTSKADYIERLYRKFTLDYAVRDEIELLSVQNSELRQLLQEYKEGIYLFDIMNKKVWAKASKDTVGLLEYFEKHQDQYMWDTKKDAIVVSYDTRVVETKDVRKLLNKVLAKSQDMEEVEKQIAKKYKNNELKVESGIYLPGNNPFVDRCNELGLSKDMTSGTTLKAFVYLKEVIPPTPKDFEDVKGLVIANYQEYLDKEWIKELRAKYPVQINNHVFESIFQN